MADFRNLGAVTPPPSEDERCHSAEPTDLPEVNNSTSPLSTIPVNTPETPPSTPDRRRRDRLSLQKDREANRSKQFTNRVRSASGEKEGSGIGRGKKVKNFQQRQRDSVGSEEGEPSQGQQLTKMAFAEQQKWITVQQKTFTKW